MPLVWGHWKTAIPREASAPPPNRLRSLRFKTLLSGEREDPVRKKKCKSNASLEAFSHFHSLSLSPHVHTYTYIPIYIRICINTYIHMYTHIYSHTHIFINYTIL